MKEQIKRYKTRLRELGFKRKTDRVYWYDNNGLFYVVTFKMEGGEIDQIGFEVSHAGMFEDGVPQQRCSPVGGWLGWEGISIGIAAYVKELPVPQAAAILERAARAFFSYFKTAADWQTAACHLQERTYLQFTPIAAHEDAGGLSVPWFINDIAQEMQNPTDFGEALHALFEKLARQAGFSTMHDDIFVRQRGEVYDCFYVHADHLNTFFRVNPFIWCDQFEGGEDGVPAFSNLNNDLLPSVEWMRTADVLRDPSLAEALLQEIIAFCTRFDTAMAWLDYLADGEHANFLLRKPERVAQLRQRLTEEADAAKTPHDTPTPMPQESGMEFVPIPAGTFTMGAAQGDEYALDWEYPQREVTITRTFLLGKYPVTQAQWLAVMGNNPSRVQGANLPVDRVSWQDVQEFIRRLNAQEGHRRYRLPTEAEWEYACRAGATGAFCCGDDASALGEYAWYDANSGGKPHPVGEKKPNAWGLHDMHGNVEEWVQDGAAKYRVNAVKDPKGPGKSDTRIFRGGSHDCGFPFCRASKRSAMNPEFAIDGVGFRLAMDGEK